MWSELWTVICTLWSAPGFLFFIYHYFYIYQSYLGDLLQLVIVRCHPLLVNISITFLKVHNCFSSLVWNIFGVRGTEIVNFIVTAPLKYEGWGPNLNKWCNLSNSLARDMYWSQKNWIVMINKDTSTRIARWPLGYGSGPHGLYSDDASDISSWHQTVNSLQRNEDRSLYQNCEIHCPRIRVLVLNG